MWLVWLLCIGNHLVYTHTNAHACACSHARTHTHIHTRKHARTHTHINTHKNTYTHAHTLAGAEAATICNHHGLGGAGATDLGQAVLDACDKPSKFEFLYDVELPIKARGRVKSVCTNTTIGCTPRPCCIVTTV